jgi:hypothetical protein
MRMHIQSASADIKPPGFSFCVRLPNGLATSFLRPMASVFHLEVRRAIAIHYKVWISNSRQKRAGKGTSSLFLSTIQSKRKYACMHRCYSDESGVTGNELFEQGIDSSSLNPPGTSTPIRISSAPFNSRWRYSRLRCALPLLQDNTSTSLLQEFSTKENPR